jgi:signal transduction histidine kinase
MTDNLITYSVLIVDDQASNIDELRRYLETENYAISGATNGEKAISLLNKLNIDILLLGTKMSDMDGYEVCRIVKEEPSTRHIPVIFATDSTLNTEDLRRCFASGAADIITRPTHQDIVKTRIKNQLYHIKQLKMESKLRESNKMAELGSMVAEISHEVSSPLGNLRLSIDYLNEKNNGLKKSFENATLTKSELNTHIEKIDKALQMCTANINLASNIMLSFKQVAVDQCSNNLLSFNLLRYTKDILLTLRPKLKRCSHEISLKIDERIELNSYPGVLSQVLINLINNTLTHAFEFIDKGDIEITAEFEIDKVVIIYRDNGIGMDTNSATNAFKKYYTTKAGQGGSGLGLSICRELVEDILGGHISLESTLGVGTAFTITLDKDIAAKKFS